MLTPELMGFGALVVLWVNVLLIAAHAWKHAQSLARASRALGPLEPATVVVGAGDGGTFAEREIQQTGRALVRGPARILFLDGAARTKVWGGVLRMGGKDVAVSSSDALVALAPSDAATRSSDERWPETYRAASTQRGATTTLRQAVVTGATVFVRARPRHGDDNLVLEAIYSHDPRRDLARGARLSVAFAVVEIGVAALLTAVALVPPVFGMVSTLGGALLLAFFLAVQPIGTAVRDRARPFYERRVDGAVDGVRP